MARDLSSDTLIFDSSDPLKVLSVDSSSVAAGVSPAAAGTAASTGKSGTARVGSYGIRFSGPHSKDLTGEYLTAATDYGPRNGDGVVSLFNHGFLSAEGLDENSQKALDAV